MVTGHLIIACFLSVGNRSPNATVTKRQATTTSVAHLPATVGCAARRHCCAAQPTAQSRLRLVYVAVGWHVVSDFSLSDTARL